jgi:predicted CXXCH cytochrome family protein
MNNKFKNIRKNIIFIVLIIQCSFIIINLTGCSPRVGNKILSFLCDCAAKPKKDTTKNNIILKTDTVKMPEIAGSKPIAPMVFKSKFNFHPPYQYKGCKICHDKGKMGSLVQSIPFLCFNCHSNFLKKFKCVHYPVATGHCTDCHSPHMSEERKLLLRKGQDICMHCHKQTETFYSDSTHKEIRDRNCIECHNPHGGKDEAMLKPIKI